LAWHPTIPTSLSQILNSQAPHHQSASASHITSPNPPPPLSQRPNHLSPLLLAAAALLSPLAVGLLHVVELVRVAVVIALAAPGPAAAAAVPASGTVLERVGLGGGLVGGRGREGAGHGGGGEEDDVELHVDFFVL
ncbi:hypothetical protein V493_01167, partial [Pseudogymnoascus sp. VKM F-4281 (FW-2241)]